MKFTDTQLAYLATQRLGRLATVDPQGAPQNNPVGAFLDAAAPRSRSAFMVPSLG